MDALDKSLPFAEGMVEAEQAGSVRSDGQPRRCLNCDTELVDRYCSHCGQKDIPKRQTLGELLINFISSFWSFESKFFKTCQYLLLKPGFLAKEYNDGKRERYYHPARMYVFISFIYFLLLTSLPDAEKGEGGVNFNFTGDKEKGGVFLDNGKKATRAQYDSVQATLPLADRDGWLVRKLNYRKIELEEKFNGNPGEFSKEVIGAFMANFSKVFFFLLPVFAFIMWLLYIRRDFFYSEHLVFSIYYYNFFFVAGSLTMLLDLVPWLGWLSSCLDIAIVLYLLLAMKRVYHQPWGKTILKYVAFLSIFGICVAMGLFVNLMITLMYI